ncbi:MAG: hypothetical protein DMF53_27005 [Acidobacteria bacterium]|nr:MAG: hypothetical protein DMF53_27005 [Acidobacteriota bacterium]
MVIPMAEPFPDDVQELLRALDENDRRAEDLVRDLDDERERARRQGAVRRGPIRPGPLGRWFVATLEPPPKRRLPAPKKIVPALRKGKAEVMAEWRRAQVAVKDLLREAAGLDLNGTRFVNPFISLLRFSLGTGFQVLPAHQRRHLWQAERVKGNPRFPAPSVQSSLGSR